MEENAEREYRINNEATVDTHDEEERALGWYYYVDDKLHAPFKAKCVSTRKTSPLVVGADVEVLGLADEDECMKELFALIKWQEKTLAVPLAQLEPQTDNAETLEAVGDWHYWIAMGYQL